MGLSASQGRLLLLTAKRSDLEFRAQQITQRRLMLSQQLEEISMTYENATSNRQMKIALNGVSNADNKNPDGNTINLTYAALMSGTTADAYANVNTGINKVPGVNTVDGYEANSAFRLVSVSGAIVVSSVQEIPTFYAEESDATVEDGDKGKALYKTQDYDALGTTVNKNILKIEDIAKSDLEDFKDAKELNYDPTTGILRVKDQDNKYEYYQISEGKSCEKIEQEEGKEIGFNEGVIIDEIAVSETPKNRTQVPTTDNGEELVPGKDGVYEIEINGKTEQYIVDPALAYGSTDNGGTMDGPNYLQDCLRNGKYLIQKLTKNPDTDEITWPEVAWDATTAIQDRYYTEDDAAAKAKYDRLQNEIQQQDKKLELELDQIETQRSAVTTEIESVQKVINENIEKTFNPFNA